MSAIFAIFNRDGRPVLPEEWQPMLHVRPERAPDGVRALADGPVAIAHGLFRLLPEEAPGDQPLAEDALLLSADVRLDNRPELACLLDLDSTAAAAPDARYLLWAYRRWGTRCPEHLLGDFAFVLWDAAERRLFAARDPLGACDVCYYRDDALCVVASEASQVLAHPRVPRRINDDRLAAYLANVVNRPEETVHRDVFFLPPAHALSVTADRFELWRYWDAAPATIRYRDEREYAVHYRELLDTAVRDRLRVVGPVGVSLSGGLDSPTLAALAAPLLPSLTGQARLKSFTYTFDEHASCDERTWIRPVVEKYDIDPTWVPCDDRWSFRDLPDWSTSPDFIFYDPYDLLPAAVRAAAAGAGVRALLAGYFGDSLMGGQHYWALDMARDGRLGMLAHYSLAHWGGFKWRNAYFEYGLRRLIPPAAAAFYRSFRPRQAETVAPGIHPDLVARTDVATRFSPVPPPDRAFPGFQQRYGSLTGSNFSQSVVVRHQYNQAGMELLLPYYDRRLVEYVLAIPAYVLGRPGDFRHLHRAAMAGLLPEEVRLRQERTTFEPLLRQGVEREMGAIRQLLADPLVVARGYVRGDWLATQLAQPYGQTAGWSLLYKAVFLELWLQRYWN